MQWCYTAFPDAQGYIKKKQYYSFAAKGGHNDEPHNHNDIGCFVILKNKKYVIDDLGWSEYDKWYFGPKRYDSICTSSKGHSVPVVENFYHLPGNGVGRNNTLDSNVFVGNSSFRR